MPTAKQLKSVANVLLVPCLLALAMSLCYIAAFHKPDPHGLKLDIVGTTQSTRAGADQLAHALGDAVVIRTVPSLDEAKQLLREQKISGAYYQNGSSATVLIATGASATSADVAKQILLPVAYAEHLPVQVQDVAPPASDDTGGQGLFFLLVAMTVGAYALGIAVGASGAAFKLSMPARATVGILAALVDTLIATIVGGPILNAIPSHWFEVMLLGWLYTSGVVLIGAGLHSLLGRFTTPVMVTLFVGLNFTTCGGVYMPVLQPAFFGALHGFWNGAGFLQAVTDLVYFPNLSVGGDALRLIIWLAVGVIALLVASHVENPWHQRHAESKLDLELEESEIVA
jgi:hypothetical protein